MQVAVATFDRLNEIESFVATLNSNRLRPKCWKAFITLPGMVVSSMNGVLVHAQRRLDFAANADAVIIGSDVKAVYSAMERLVMLTGSCLCGSVAYEVEAPSGSIVHCHCSTCRKTHGAAFSTVMPVPRESFRWLRGEELLSSFESSPGKLRRFCTQCGSHIIADRPSQPNVLLRLGCLDTPITDRPKLHMWRSEAASWYDPADVLPEFSKAPS